MADLRPSPIAIIGMACRLPGGSDNPDKLWDMLSEGRSGWREIPADRWNKDSFYHPDPEAKEAINTKSLYFLDQDISAFDARFFNIHPHEAHCLDPQQRILLETAYEALENAGQTLESIKGSDTSVHVGAYATDFERMGYKDISRTPKAHMIGTGIAILSNRISYVFDLKGPSSTVDTGCSGSMVALHQACHGLRARESKMAIVAGTQLVLTPDQIIPMSSVGMTNPDGKCYVFDSRGAGYARGEGVVTLILKRLADAVGDGDKIHAIIRNSGLNQDGKTAGLTLPNPAAQADLIRQVYRNAGLSPAETAYVEAHGTGTQAGDSAEISSIAEVFTKDGREGDLYVGSIKSNIGHLEASSGVAGLLKAILILKHGNIPPNIDFIKPKPTLHLEERKIKVATEMVPLPETTVRRVSVNSFGYGGTNAHVILEAPSTYQEPIERTHSTNGTNGTNGVHFENGTHGTTVIQLENGTNGYSKGPSKSKTLETNGHPTEFDTMSPSSDKGDNSQLFVLSARSEASLQAMVSKLHQWVSARKDESYFRNLAYTLSTRRTKLQYRFSTAASNHDDLLNQLEQKPRITKSVTNFRSVFLFTGQGAQWHAMGRELTLHQPVFRKSMWKSDSILKALGADWSLIGELSKDEKGSRVGDAEISQPSTTAIQIALVDLLKTFGVSPDLVLGHSSGEIAAAYAAEALEHEAALEISYRRGFMSKACARVISSKGAMMAVGLGEHDVQKYIEQTRTGLVNVACVNSPVSTTISGDEAAIDELKQNLDEESIFNRKLKVDTAYHSHHMKKVASEYLASIAHVKARTPNHAIKFYSSVSVTQKTGGFDAQYWVDNLVSPVRFGNALDLLVRTELVGIEPAPLTLLTEVGPHGALGGPVRQIIQGLGLPSFKSNYLPTLVRGRHAVLSILETAGKLFEFGYPVALEATLGADDPAKPATLIDDLPPYSWDHSTSYLYESNLSKQHRFRAHPPHDLLGLRVAGTTNHEPTWRNFLGVDSLPWLRDHVVDGFAIYPAAAYLSMAIEAARQIAIDRKIQGVMSRVHLKNVTFTKSIMIPERRTDGLTADVEVMLTLRPGKHLADRTWETFRIMALSTEDVWHEHCSGSVMIEWAAKKDDVEGFREEDMMISSQLKRLQDIRDACDTTIDHDELYANFAENGNVYGPTFNGIQSVQVGPLGGIANVLVPDVRSVMPKQWQQPHLIHPASFDAVFQLGIPLYRRNVGNGPVMPTGVDEVSINCNLGSEPGTKWVATTTLSEIGVRFAVAEIMVFEETAEGAPPKPMITIKGGSLRGIGEAPLDESALPFSRKMSYRLKWQPDVDYLPLLQMAEQSESQSSSVVPQLVTYMQLLSFKQPHMKILEIGAGNGDVARAVLETVDRPEGLLLDKYSYTNINAETLEQGKAILQKWVDCVDFKTLDLSTDPVTQGFQEGEFDLIIASSDALQGVGSLDEGLANSRKLLKTGGRMIVLSQSPSTSDAWQSRLTTNHGHDFHPVHVATPQLIVATASDAQSPPRADFPPVSIICESETAGFAALAQAITTCLTSQGFACSLGGWPASPVDADAIYIVLDDVADPVLAAPSTERFTQIVSLLTRAKSVLWLSGQESGGDVLHPSKGMINGLARVVRRENAGMRLVTVNMQEDIAHPESLVALILEVVSRSFATPIRARRSTEDEYTFSNGQTLISRVHTDFKFNDYVTKSLYPQRVESGLYQQTDRPLKLELETPGLLSSLRFVDDDVPSKPLGPFDLELEARAYGINFKDVFIAMGQMVPGVTMTGECAGIVRRVGSALTDQYRVGDRVCGIGAEPFSSHPRIDGNLSGRIPPWMSFAVGASIPIIFCTAYHCIVEVARLQRGQTILIHAASGGVGQAAIQLAQNIGAEIFCTVGSSEKRQLLIDNFNIPPSHIFSSRLRTFKQGILRLTQNKGVDCVLNSLSGESLHDSFAVLAPLGTFVEIGKSDIYKKNDINMMPFDRNVTFAAVDLTVLAKIKRAEMRVRLSKILSMFEEGTLQAVKPITTTPMTDIEEAFRLIQSRKHTGKVVLVCDEKTQVKLTVARPKPLILDKNGSYVIAGGLGDLGRRIARYLAAHGAGHVVTLSRRKLDEEDQLTFEKELQSLGAELHIICCDITDKESVQSAAAWCSANLPSVKGVVHAGMVLRDRPFESMSHDDYVTSLKPKVQGTQNLDAAFGVSDSLAFFIMLSSITAILGTAGQSNYAVGNAFQDAFAQSKVNSKCRYVAVNLGAVDGSLAITSLPAAQQEKMRLGTALMSFEEVFTVLGYAMSPQARQDDLSQLILGFDRKSMEAVHDGMALANPVFSQIPYLEAKGETAETSSTDIGKMLQQASTSEEIHSIVVGGICQRFAMFIACAPEDISPDVSMDNFGLDSLVAIELKNWLVRTFQTTLQTSEVLDASNINSLARTIASRSKLIAKGTEPDKKVENGAVDQALVKPEGAASVSSRDHDFHCCKAFKTLNKLPLNDFETIFDDYLENSKMFFTPEEFQTLERDVAEFRQPGSMGRKCYDRLHQQAHDPEIENWQDRYFLQSMYLQRRMPLAPFNNFMAFHPLGMEHTQAERAALIAKIAFQCKQDLEADKWEPMAYLGTANCTDLWQYIFNTARLPGVPLDRMAKFPGNDHIAVFHRGHIYKVDPIDGNQNLSIEALTNIFQSILDRDDIDENWTSILSADDRTSWAENRDALIKLDPINKETIDMVETSAFLVCLDETKPTDAEDRIRQMMMRDGFNRWVDKSIAFVVCKNATSGTYVEHTMIDAMTLYTMQTAIVEGITTYKPPRHVNGHSNGVSQPPQEFILKTTPALEDRVLQVRERFVSEIKKFGYRDVILSEFGTDVLLDRRLPIKGIYDLMCLLANYYYYGYNAQSWEAVSMSHYHKGRPDIVQVNTPKTAHFCTIADDESLPARERFEIMLDAANARNQTIKDAFMGHCYQRTLRALELCVEEGEEVPALFKNPLYERTVEPDQMFGNTDGLSPESCFIMQNPKKFWMTYYVTDAGSHFSVIAGKEEVIAWADCLQRASVVMKTLIDAA